MSITTKIIITDTNIITDLNNANLLNKFISLDNVYIGDLVLADEINGKTGNMEFIKNFKILSFTSEQLEEISNLSKVEKKLSTYDLMNFVLARDNNGILATGDQRLKIFAEKNHVEVIRTLKIIELMKEYKLITIKETIDAYRLLKDNPHTRIPIEEINLFIEKNSVLC